MSRDELERFLTPTGRQAVDRFISEAQQESDDFDVAEALDRNLYDAMLRHDSRAGLTRWLELRFTGPRAAGRMAEDAVEDVLSAFRREVSGASTAKSMDLIKFDLVGFSQGSAILHLIPAETASIDPGDAPDNAQQALAAGEDPIDYALGLITELHHAAESAGDVLRFSGQEKLLRGFAALTEALDKHDLDMGITWRSRTGRRRTSQLTSRGREYARQYLDRVDTSDILTITGRVVELSISGSFDLKTSIAPNSPRFKISAGDEETLLDLHLELGQTVTVRVRRRTERNKLGVPFGTHYEYLDMSATDEPLA